MSSLSWRHHTLIQALLSRGPLKEEEFHKIFAEITGKNPGSQRQFFNEYLLKINKELSCVQFELRGCRNQYDGEVYYGVVNTVVDEPSKLGTKYDAPQIAFYKGIIEAIVQDGSAQGSIPSIVALNVRAENQIQVGTGSQSEGVSSQLPTSFRKFTMSQKEKTLNELAELCKNEACTVRIHAYCLKRKFARVVERVCPGCGAPWEYTVPKIESVQEEEIELCETQQPSQPITRKRLQNIKAENLDIAGTSSQASMPNLRRNTRRSTRCS
ncbi:Non-structural maintenance of chromosomes element 1 [Dillenia turbinata]|uniref:Non-structural maintenance of chromosomes element 1 homolog n=1 Tax=Dillenia turbinata TaxID=194707 RepID=A0AAN8VUD5_9MAGN